MGWTLKFVGSRSGPPISCEEAPKYSIPHATVSGGKTGPNPQPFSDATRLRWGLACLINESRYGLGRNPETFCQLDPFRTRGGKTSTTCEPEPNIGVEKPIYHREEFDFQLKAGIQGFLSQWNWKCAKHEIRLIAQTSIINGLDIGWASTHRHSLRAQPGNTQTTFCHPNSTILA